jgi:hypothetical protein
MYLYIIIITGEFCPTPPQPFLEILNFVCRYLVGLLGQATSLLQAYLHTSHHPSIQETPTEGLHP